MEEIWKEIIGFPNYTISNFGNVKNIKRNKLMAKTIKSGGYLVVKINNSEGSKEFRIHRLVAIHFIDNPNNYPCVNHKDEIKVNNHIDNLEWCGHQYNNTYGDRIEKAKKKLYVRVEQYTKDGQFIREYSSVNEAGKLNNILPCNISNALSGRQRFAGGFIWKHKT